jgi:hypothetical protein
MRTSTTTKTPPSPASAGLRPTTSSLALAIAKACGTGRHSGDARGPAVPEGKLIDKWKERERKRGDGRKRKSVMKILLISCFLVYLIAELFDRFMCEVSLSVCCR